MTNNEKEQSVDVTAHSDATEIPKEEDNPKMHTRVRLIRFFLVSCFTGLLALGTFTLGKTLFLDATPLPYDWSIRIAETLSVTASCVFSFFINSKFTFEDRKARRAGILLYLVFYVVITPLGSELILWLNKCGLHIILSKLVKMTINLIVDFVYCRFFLFAYLRKRFDVTTEPTKE